MVFDRKGEESTTPQSLQFIKECSREQTSYRCPRIIWPRFVCNMCRNSISGNSQNKSQGTKYDRFKVYIHRYFFKTTCVPYNEIYRSLDILQTLAGMRKYVVRGCFLHWFLFSYKLCSIMLILINIFCLKLLVMCLFTHRIN